MRLRIFFILNCTLCLQMTASTQNFPLLNEIDEHHNSNNIDWNKNAFETLLVKYSIFLILKTKCQTSFLYSLDIKFA